MKILNIPGPWLWDTLANQRKAGWTPIVGMVEDAVTWSVVFVHRPDGGPSTDQVILPTGTVRSPKHVRPGVRTAAHPLVVDPGGN